jgi:prephenate dehydratase
VSSPIEAAALVVGYQGIGGSFSEGAAIELLRRAGIGRYRLEPCVTSAEVVRRLQDARIECGVLALRNVVGGEVQESADALRGVVLRELIRASLPIVHCLYARVACDPSAIVAVHSHEQALRQCRDSLDVLCPHAARITADDTALAARNLAEGRYAEGSAVVCSRIAGEGFGLHLIHEGIQDRADNLTEFALLARSRPEQRT